jgi:DNA-binding NarL/FixJ family response regulator
MADTASSDNLDLQKRSGFVEKYKTLLGKPIPFLPMAKNDIPKSPVRIFLVDDFEAWRQYVCSELKTRQQLQIVGQASDGLEAVHIAEELKPDLILLDIGLPNLNGIEAARQIGKVAPESKIIFVTQESSPEIVQAALSSGARGYVAKTRAASDLLAAIEAVLEGRQFVSSGLIAARGLATECDT